MKMTEGTNRSLTPGQWLTATHAQVGKKQAEEVVGQVDCGFNQTFHTVYYYSPTGESVGSFLVLIRFFAQKYPVNP
jgi:hypothetical protein